jgi:hypothetical protein
MQLADLVKPIEECSEDELMERLRGIRHNRSVGRPAGKAREKRATKKGAKGRIDKVKFLLNGLSREQLMELLGDDLGEGNGSGAD